MRFARGRGAWGATATGGVGGGGVGAFGGITSDGPPARAATASGLGFAGGGLALFRASSSSRPFCILARISSSAFFPWSFFGNQFFSAYHHRSVSPAARRTKVAILAAV